MPTSHALGFVLVAVISLATQTHAEPLTSGKVTRYAKELDSVVGADARVEKLVDGFTWAEGPTWVAAGKYLLFTDVPENTMYRWSQQDGLSDDHRAAQALDVHQRIDERHGDNAEHLGVIRNRRDHIGRPSKGYDDRLRETRDGEQDDQRRNLAQPGS